MHSPTKSAVRTFMSGLRFDTQWRYAVCTPSRRTRWATLPAVPDAQCLPDPLGAWWCARRCAAVLRQRAWLQVQLPLQLTPQPGPQELAQVLALLLPGWRAQLENFPALAPLRCAQAMQRGGSAMLLLEMPGHRFRDPAVFWMWVIGMERSPQRLRPAKNPKGLQPSPPAQPLPEALLAMPARRSKPGASRHVTRIQMDATGRCISDDAAWPLDGCRWLACITLERLGLSSA
ncbi:hypothetical protein OSS46_19755 [Delftia tsuruhatensis]|nr:hypothetical protein [Delftia tsuruhatensis]